MATILNPNALSPAVRADTSTFSEASSAASALASATAAAAAAAQAQLLAGVTATYSTNAAMQSGIASIAANASVLVLADEARQGQTSVYQKVAGVMTYQGVVQYYGATTASVGDVDPEGTIYLFPGDSTTEQSGASGFGFDLLTNEYRSAGGPLNRIVGMINFGGSGHKLSTWVDGALGTVPTYSTSNLGVSQNDYYGHKATGAYTLATELAWRSANVSATTKVVWLPCYGINDCILDASIGNLTQSAITDYIAGYLRQAVRRILSAFPKDKIILRTPNPMTARPFTPPGPGFPSITEYPNFGLVLATDQALVEKWNQALRNAYFAVRNEFPGVSVYDKWELVYGRSDTTLTASTQLPFLGDLVHPSSSGYQQEAHTMVSFLAPKAKMNPRQLTGRKAEAIARSAILAVNPWEYYPPYLDNNFRFQFAMEGVLAARGAAFIDITCTTADFFNNIRNRPIYVQIGEAAAQKFTTYTATDLSGLGTTIRLGSITVSAAMQAAAVTLPVRVYIDPLPKLATATTLNNTLNELGGMFLPEPFSSGGTFSASSGTAVASIITIEVYSVASSARTLLGTISIGANAVNATLASGNPTSTPASAWYEFKVTSATVAGNRLQVKFTPT